MKYFLYCTKSVAYCMELRSRVRSPELLLLCWETSWAAILASMATRKMMTLVSVGFAVCHFYKQVLWFKQYLFIFQMYTNVDIIYNRQRGSERKL